MLVHRGKPQMLRRRQKVSDLSTPTPCFTHLLALVLGALLGLCLFFFTASEPPDSQAVLVQDYSLATPLSLPAAALPSAALPAAALPAAALLAAVPPSTAQPAAAAVPVLPASPKPFDALSFLAHLTPADAGWGLSAAGGAPLSYAPWVGASSASQWREFSAAELLQCLSHHGGIAFIGDSTTRETVNALLLLLQSGDAVSTQVPHAQQQYTRTFPGAPNATLAFRFARSLHPELLQKAVELLAPEGPGLGALVASSGFWDLSPEQGGGSHTEALATYATRMARFLQGLWGALPQGTSTSTSASTSTSPGRRQPALLWRTITPTAYSRAPADRRDYLSLGRTAAANALAQRFLAAWNAQAQAQAEALPRWAVLDAELLMPAGREESIAEDGYHPSPHTLQLLVHAIFSELCPSPSLQLEGMEEVLAVARAGAA